MPGPTLTKHLDHEKETKKIDRQRDRPSEMAIFKKSGIDKDPRIGNLSKSRWKLITLSFLAVELFVFVHSA